MACSAGEFHSAQPGLAGGDDHGTGWCAGVLRGDGHGEAEQFFVPVGDRGHREHRVVLDFARAATTTVTAAAWLAVKSAPPMRGERVEPGDFSVISHDPAATPLPLDSGAWHERVPSLTVTVPVEMDHPHRRAGRPPGLWWDGLADNRAGGGRGDRG